MWQVTNCISKNLNFHNCWYPGRLSVHMMGGFITVGFSFYHILFFWFQTCMIAEYLLTKVSLRGFKGIYQIWSLNLFHSRINPTSLMQVDFKINIYSIKQKQEYVSKQHCFMWNTITFFLFFGRGVCVGGWGGVLRRKFSLCNLLVMLNHKLHLLNHIPCA
jgi:hypothetical protein